MLGSCRFLGVGLSPKFTGMLGHLGVRQHVTVQIFIEYSLMRLPEQAISTLATSERPQPGRRELSTCFMVVSAELLALMSFHSPNRRGGVTSWSIDMDFRYPFPWKTVSAFVLKQKAKGPPDEMVTLEMDGNLYKYTVKMPWYSRWVLGRTILWHDVLEVDQSSKILSEDGENVSLQRLGTVRDVSSWRCSEDDPNVTLYKKRLDFSIRMPLSQSIMMQVASPLIRWFKTKSLLCRELEVQAIREHLLQSDGEDEVEDLASLIGARLNEDSPTAESAEIAESAESAESEDKCESGVVEGGDGGLAGATSKITAVTGAKATADRACPQGSSIAS